MTRKCQNQKTTATQGVVPGRKTNQSRLYTRIQYIKTNIMFPHTQRDDRQTRNHT